jgi:hypothetical protein
MADSGDSTSTGTEGTSTSGDVDTNSGSSDGSEAKPDPPTSTFGSGRGDDEEKKQRGFGGATFKNSLAIPVLRVATREEITATGWPDPSVFIDTVEVPVPSIDGFLTAFAQPEPEPTPGPALRGLEEAPVVDATGSGGAEPVAADGAPPVFQVPLVVVVPGIATPGIAAPLVPLGASASGGPPVAAGAPSVAAGAKVPLVRGSLSAAAEKAPSMTPMSGQATRVGYPRYLRNPTVGELAAVALPGVGGLMFLTFSGGAIGYRQANSIRFIRTGGTERFLQ